MRPETTVEVISREKFGVNSLADCCLALSRHWWGPYMQRRRRLTRPMLINNEYSERWRRRWRWYVAFWDAPARHSAYCKCDALWQSFIAAAPQLSLPAHTDWGGWHCLHARRALATRIPECVLGCDSASDLVSRRDNTLEKSTLIRPPIDLI